jgi:hypothetical protein
VGAALFGCSQDVTNPVSPVSRVDVGGLKSDFNLANPQVLKVIAIQNRETPKLMAMRGVVGTATTLTDDGRLGIMILTEHAMGAALPASIDGLPVVENVTGVIRPMAIADHRVKQTPPIQMGTSGGWRYDLANGFCCGGTLGSCVKKGTTQYVLSNYHVLEGDIVSGGNGRVATAGDPVVQPGLIDVNCTAASAQNVASLSGIKSLPSSNVDCAIASVTAGQVRTDGAILEVGTISASTVGASIGQAVKKSGRTTGLSRSSISGLNATVSVAYENECAGGSAFTKTFTGQIIVRNRASKFLNSGDSGSLMVEDVSTNPRAVGLLFAGSSSTAVANPIGQVLSFLGATMVGQ